MTNPANTSQDYFDGYATNHELACGCALQLRYIMITLELMDLGDASGAIMRGLKGARKADLRNIIESLRAIKRETRAVVEAGKRIQDSKPRNAWEGG